MSDVLPTDLVARLRAAPKAANFVEVDEGNWAVTVYPFGELCHKAADELERLERERAEWSGTAAQRLRETQMVLHERDCAVEKLAETTEEFAWLLHWSGAKNWHGWWDSRLVESCGEPLRSRMTAHFQRLRHPDVGGRDGS